MSTTIATDGMEPPVAPSRRGWAWVVAVGLLALTIGFAMGRLGGSAATVHRYVYTGTVSAVCGDDGQIASRIPSCFALTPDPGTAHRDGYYAGGGDVSFGPPPEASVLHAGAHVTVTVVSVTDEGSAVVEVSPAADPGS